MSECTHDCSNCSSNCSSKGKESLLKSLHEGSHVKKVIGIVSGKGGVGKSLVTSLLASTMNKAGFTSAILDADITGPSIPQMFGLHGRATGTEEGINPVCSKNGVKVISLNFLLDNETDPVIWRGPVIANVVQQFWTDVLWGDVDYMFVDMPPGTGDVPLTVFQSIPVDGIVIVASPQELVGMIVSKAINMAKMMNIPIVGIIENYSYFKCPNCGEEYKIFSGKGVEKAANDAGIPILANVPIDPNIATACDTGTIEDYDNNYLQKAIDILKKF